MFPDLRMGRTECWHFKDGSLNPRLSLRSRRDYELKPFHLTQQVCMRPVVCYRRCPNGSFECLCAQFIIILAAQALSRVYSIIYFIFAMRFGNSLDIVLLGYQHDLVCLFSSEAQGAAGLRPGEHFNYNHSITTLCFKVREVDCRKGFGGKRMPTITRNDPSTPCYSTHS